jgi:hypothetical protein
MKLPLVVASAVCAAMLLRTISGATSGEAQSERVVPACSIALQGAGGWLVEVERRWLEPVDFRLWLDGIVPAVLTAADIVHGVVAACFNPVWPIASTLHLKYGPLSFWPETGAVDPMAMQRIRSRTRVSELQTSGGDDWAIRASLES